MVSTVINLSGLNGENGFRLDGKAEGNFLRSSVSSAGDVNGDGFDDVIIGADFTNSNGKLSSSSYIIFGKTSGFEASVNLSELDGNNGFRLYGEKENDRSGSPVSNAGDVNGDGFDDLIVGAFLADPTGHFSGSSYIIFGKTSGFEASMNLSELDGSNGFRLHGVTGELLGLSVSNAGDVNGDGFDDVIAGSLFAAPNGQLSGSSFVVFGKTSGFEATLDLSSLDGSNGFRLDGEAEYDYSGRSVSGAGDVNGDRFDDVIVGANGADPNGVSSGSSYVVFGKASGFEATLDLSNLDGSNGFRLDGEAEYDYSGRSVSGAGDVNGDGFDDVIVGSLAADPNGERSGSTYVVFGKAAGFDATLNLSNLNSRNGFRLDGMNDYDYSGHSVSDAGDVNGDGFNDVIIGAYGADPNGNESGSSYIIFGKNSSFNAPINLSSLDSKSGFRLDGVVGSGKSGDSASGTGDVNGDGFDDLIVGTYGANQNGRLSEFTYIIFGRSQFTGSNMIEGTPGDDILVGGNGDDDLIGNDGNDTIDGGTENDVLTGGLGNDILLAGFGKDQLLGNEGNDIFGFYAPGHFEIQDLNLSGDHIYFGVTQTGLSNIDEVNQMITAVNQRESGVEVEFGPDASINLIGINFNDITADMVGFA